MSGLSATKAESFLHAFLAFLSREFPYFDNIYVHGIGVTSFGGGGKGVVGLMGRFRVSFGDFFSAFPLGLERDGLFVPVIDGRGDSVHGHDSAHEGGRDSGGEVSDKDILVGDACKHRVVFKVRNIFDEGWGVSVVLPFGHAFGGEPGDGGSSDIVMFEGSFEFGDEIRERAHGDSRSGDGVLSECGCPSEGGSFGHVEEGKGDHFVIGVVDFVVDEEVEAYSVQPLGGFIVRSVKGFQCSNTEFGGFRRRQCIGQGKQGKSGKDWVGSDWSRRRGSGDAREVGVCELVG